ncbi:hypothetical protein EV182_008062, partial [Spiromyces aspiralis]
GSAATPSATATGLAIGAPTSKKSTTGKGGSNKKSGSSISRRAPKSKVEVSERMRRWRKENVEKNKLNDLRCRVYRQARNRFGKDPTPEREAWIQSEIFRRMEKRRMRELMKNSSTANSSAPAADSNDDSSAGPPATADPSTPTSSSAVTPNAGVSSAAYSFMNTPYHGSQYESPAANASGSGSLFGSNIGGSAGSRPATSSSGFKFINTLYNGRTIHSYAPSAPTQQQQQQQHAATSTTPLM